MHRSRHCATKPKQGKSAKVPRYGGRFIERTYDRLLVLGCLLISISSKSITRIQSCIYRVIQSAEVEVKLGTKQRRELSRFRG